MNNFGFTIELAWILLDVVKIHHSQHVLREYSMKIVNFFSDSWNIIINQKINNSSLWLKFIKLFKYVLHNGYSNVDSFRGNVWFEWFLEELAITDGDKKDPAILEYKIKILDFLKLSNDDYNAQLR